jgi:membrane protease YdiL (CAAX protease family)
VILAAIVWYIAAFCIGCVVLVITLVALFRAAPASPADAPDRTQVALILGETFAVWMVLFFLMNLGAGLLGQAIVEASGLQDTPTAVHVGLACGAVGFFGSLVALFWARLRGVSGAVVREALGLHAGRGVLREAMQGILCYLAAVPLLVAGLIVFVILTAIVHAIFGPPKAPSHPVAELFAEADALRIALIALVATVAAPVVEEIMFRGALYGHLRTTVFARHRILSVLVAAGVSSFIFAVIHPQGVLFTPALGGLAVSFCLYREARGSLIAPMVAHGIQNGVTLTMGLMLMS